MSRYLSAVIYYSAKFISFVLTNAREINVSNLKVEGVGRE